MKRKNMTVSKKTTRRALGMNILSLLLCVSMLIGTTFAWFTDSVTSGRNQIIAGNLDVEVYHGQSTTIDKTDANKVTSATELFTVDRWEPGMVVYENIMIANVGDMALKYKMALREWAKNTVDNGEHDLSEVLTIKVIDGGFAPTSTAPAEQRAEAKAAANAVTAAFDAETTGTLYPVGTTGEGKSSEKIYGIVIFWEPSDNDNTYNINNDKTVDSLAPDENGLLTLNRLYLEIGLDVIATQVEHESDSFDQNYDQISALADLPERLNGSARSGGIRRISKDNTTQVTVTEEGKEISTTASDKVDIKIETTVQTDIQTETTKQTVVGAEVPAEAALKVMDDTFASGFTPKTEQQSQDDVLVLTMDVQTKEATESSVSVDVSLFADATRTLTTAATDTTEEEKTVEQKTNVPVTELSKPVTVELQLDKNLKNVKVTHSHYNSTEKKTETKEFASVDSLSALDNQKFYYDASTGKLTLKTDKFSIVDITYDKPYVCQIGNTAAAVGYATLEEAIAAAKNGDVIYLTKDITTGAVAIPANKTITIDGNNKTVTLTDRALFNNSGLDDLTLDGIGANANLTVKNLTMVSNTKQFALITAVAPRDQGAATVVFDGCTFKNMYSAVYGNTMESDDSFALTIKNSKFENCTYGVSIEKDENWTVAFTGNTMTGETAIQELFTSPLVSEPSFTVTDGSYSKDPSAQIDTKVYHATQKDGVYTIGKHVAGECTSVDSSKHSVKCTICEAELESAAHEYSRIEHKSGHVFKYICDCGYVEEKTQEDIGTVRFAGTDFITDENKATFTFAGTDYVDTLSFDPATNTIKLLADVEIGQLDLKVNSTSNQGTMILDLNGFVLTNNSWGGFDVHTGYFLMITDSNPDTEHAGAIMAYYEDLMWDYAGREARYSSNYSKVADYTIKGGIITNTLANKPGEPLDGSGISTEDNVTLVMNGGTIAGIYSNGDIAGICMDREWKGGCKLYLLGNAGLVGCSAAAGGVEVRGDTKMYMADNAHISYCSAGNNDYPGGGVVVYGSSLFTMNGGRIDHCTSPYGGEGAAMYINGGSGTDAFIMNGGTIEYCEGQSVIWGHNGNIVFNGGTISNSTSTANGLIHLQGTFDTTAHYKHVTLNDVNIVNNTINGNCGVFDQNDNDIVVNDCNISSNTCATTWLFCCNDGKLTIHGGTFDGNIINGRNSDGRIVRENNDKLTIDGGTFTNNKNSNGDLVPLVKAGGSGYIKEGIANQ